MEGEIQRRSRQSVTREEEGEELQHGGREEGGAGGAGDREVPAGLCAASGDLAAVIMSGACQGRPGAGQGAPGGD